MHPVRLALALFAIVASCNNRGASPPAAPVDVTVGAVGDAGIIVGSKRSPQARCTAKLTLNGELDKAATCNVDSHITDGPGTLAYPCGGEGPAEARFGEEKLAGTIRGGYLRLEIKTNPDWHDGCGWESRQLVEGHVNDRRLAWKYEETLLEDRGKCFSPCEATATIDLDPEE
jgi:hypothetical protein